MHEVRKFRLIISTYIHIQIIYKLKFVIWFSGVLVVGYLELKQPKIFIQQTLGSQAHKEGFPPDIIIMPHGSSGSLSLRQLEV